MRDAYRTFADVRRECPVLHGPLHQRFGIELPPMILAPPGMVYTAMSYEAVTQVLRDDEAFSARGYASTVGLVFGHSILEMDDPEHQRHRALLQQAFSLRAMERWECEIVHPIVHRLVDGFAGRGRADLVHELTFPFPIQVIAAMLGLPADDLDRFHRWAVQLISIAADPATGFAASMALRDYFAPLLAARRAHPRDDLISVLAHAELEGERLDDEAIFAFLRLLLPAGAETTYRSTSNLLFGLLTHPEQLAALRADRGLMKQAIEEGLRWEPPLTGISRTATRDVVVAGVPVPGGAVVGVCLGAANHDEQRWERADEFDLSRPQRPHMAFAAGAHTCLGIHLARMETRVVLDALLDRLPGLRLDPHAEDVHITGLTFRAPRALPVCSAPIRGLRGRRS